METEKIVQSLYALKHTYLCDINIFISYRYSYRINLLNKLRTAQCTVIRGNRQLRREYMSALTVNSSISQNSASDFH